MSKTIEKIKLDAKFVKALDCALNESEDFKDNPDALMEVADDYDESGKCSGYFYGPLFPLNSLRLYELAKALYVGYEIDGHGHEVGDYVSSKKTERTVQVTKVSAHRVNGVGAKGGEISFDTEFIALATEAEIKEYKQTQFWYGHGKEVGHYVKGDILVLEPSKILFTVERVFSDISGAPVYKLDDSTAYTREELLQDFRVACFAKDRLDVEYRV